MHCNNNKIGCIRQTLQHTAILCGTLQRTAAHHNALQCTATTYKPDASNRHHNALQHTATHGSTLQHTATHCNTLQQQKTRGIQQTLYHLHYNNEDDPKKNHFWLITSESANNNTPKNHFRLITSEPANNNTKKKTFRLSTYEPANNITKKKQGVSCRLFSRQSNMGLCWALLRMQLILCPPWLCECLCPEFSVDALYWMPLLVCPPWLCVECYFECC